MEENNLEEKKERIYKKFLAESSNIFLILILLFAFILRLYFFIKVGNQPLWWDEAAYGSLARNLVSHTWDGTKLIVGETLIRPMLFPLLWSILMRIGINETGVRFLLELLPSIISVFLVYLIGKELYDKKVGLMASFIFSVLWIHLFYTVRLLVHMQEVIFLFAGIYYFIKSTKEEKIIYKYFILSLIFLSIGTLFRYTNGIIFFVYFIMLIIEKKLLLNHKKFWISGIIGILPILIFFLINLTTYGNIFPALLGGDYLNPAGSDETPAPYALNLLKNIPIYLSGFYIMDVPNISIKLLVTSLFFFFFLIGIFIALFEIIIGYNFIVKNRRLKNNLLLILILVVVYSFFIFYMKLAEDRYFFPTAISLVCFAAIGLNSFYSIIKKYSKPLAICLILLILISGAYFQLKFADELINSKKQSFLQIRQGFEWMKSNVPEGSSVAGLGIEPYVIYYSKLKTVTLQSEFNQSLIEEADYIILHAFTPQEPYLINYVQNNSNKWILEKAFFSDENNQQPAFLIYKKIKTN